MLKAAKDQKILHANSFNAIAGYLGDGSIAYSVSELPSPKSTVCLELIDEELKLQSFLKANEAELQEAVSILLHPIVQIIS